LFFVRTRRAISIAKAMRVNSAARNETKDAMSKTVMWLENERRKAKNVTPAATGWTAKPRVQLAWTLEIWSRDPSMTTE